MSLTLLLTNRFKDWLQTLPWLKLGPSDAMPFEIGNRRIYVLPTRFGLFVGLALAVLNLGALNFNNNAALLLGFIIISACNNSLIAAHLSLLGLRIQVQSIKPVFAGQLCILPFVIESNKSSQTNPPRVVLRYKNNEAELTLNQQQNSGLININTEKRGVLAVDKLQLFTLYPLGLAKAWSTINLRSQTLIYPAPKGQPLQQLFSAMQGIGGTKSKLLTDQPHHLREFKTGDSRKQIAWKASARTGNLQVREYESAQSELLVLDWHTLHFLAYEQKIEQLCLWVVQASQKNLSFALHLPHQKISSATGHEHQRVCLEALALMPYDG
ncbi:MAG: DUF58 domain-containing protein [Arenimonas sp.]|nr:DUF58 domain-containing protein [Arenimonas sp.]